MKTAVEGVIENGGSEDFWKRSIKNLVENPNFSKMKAWSLFLFKKRFHNDAVLRTFQVYFLDCLQTTDSAFGGPKLFMFYLKKNFGCDEAVH